MSKKINFEIRKNWQIIGYVSTISPLDRIVGAVMKDSSDTEEKLFFPYQPSNDIREELEALKKREKKSQWLVALSLLN